MKMPRIEIEQGFLLSQAFFPSPSIQNIDKVKNSFRAVRC
jgi:hypothetical protein